MIFARSFAMLSGVVLLFVGCAKEAPKSTPESLVWLDGNERKEVVKITPDTTKEKVKSIVDGKFEVEGKARFAVLYYLDQPAHREALVDWLSTHHAEILFESKTFGYLDAEIEAGDLLSLIETQGKIGLDNRSIYKIEVDDLKVKEKKEEGSKSSAKKSIALPAENTEYVGPVHSAGYGANVEKFKQDVASSLGIPVDQINGQGMKVAVYDGGMDLSRTDVFDERLKDFYIGEEKNWLTPKQTVEEYLKTAKLKNLPEELKTLEGNATVRFYTFNESSFSTDLNGDGQSKSEITVVVYESNKKNYARFKVHSKLTFGDEIEDFGVSLPVSKKTINLYTGKYYVRDPLNPSPSAVGLKFKKIESDLKIALVGIMTRSEHGIANLHMVGGNYSTEKNPYTQKQVTYQGVAPKVNFLAMQTWSLNNSDYGSRWIPLARSIIQAAEAKADVIDLDIYTPGTINAYDILSGVLCRVTYLTDSIPVIAAHNYGPLPNTVQSLAQSPCALGIGASHSVGAVKYSRRMGSVDPKYSSDDQVITAHYSGRGFGMNGLLKPDIIAPAYAYTAYGSSFIRFGGTSGATPTTAGAIALLKQAAKLKNKTLNLSQVRFLLQASSSAVDPDHLRDGYGYLDLAAAWNLFLNIKDTLEPLEMSGHKFLQFTGRPTVNNFAVTFSRLNVRGGLRAPVPMKIWLEWVKKDSNSPVEFLKIFDRVNQKVSQSITWDAPMPGESESVYFNFELDKKTWDALPVGEHIVILKAVREQYSNLSRAADFSMPIVITKGVDVAEKKFETKPLYAEQFETFYFNSIPGDTFLISGFSKCLGTPLSTSPELGTHSALGLVIDHEESYPHSSDVMNGYGPLSLVEGPIRVKSNSHLLRIAVARRSDFNCMGAMSGELLVKRIGIGVQSDFITFKSNADESMTLLGRANVELKSGDLNESNLSQGYSRSYTLRQPVIKVFKNITKGNSDVSFPAPLKLIRVYPYSGTSSLQGILYLEEDGKLKKQTSTSIFSHYSSGFSSISKQWGDGFLGPNFSDLSPNAVVHFTSFNALPYRYEMVLDSKYVESEVNWHEFNLPFIGANEIQLNYRIDLSAKLMAALKGYSGEVQVPIRLKQEYNPATGNGYVRVEEQELDEAVVSVPMAF